MVWYLIFFAGLAIILAGLVQYFRFRKPTSSMLMLNGGVVAFIGWVGISAQHEQAHQLLQLARYRQWLFGGGGVAVLLWAVYQFWINLGSLRWPSTSGTILTSEVQGISTAKQQFEAFIRYRYAVGGRTYESSRRTLDQPEPISSFTANHIVKRYPVGKQAPVYYNPDHPAEACLERSVISGTWLVPLLISGFLLSVVYFQKG